jgi:hypothetical protein
MYGGIRMVANTSGSSTTSGFRTENISNSVALVVYPWNEAYALQQRREGILQIDLSTRPPVSITQGLTYTGFSRNKKVGSMEIVLKKRIVSLKHFVKCLKVFMQSCVSTTRLTVVFEIDQILRFCSL